MLAEVISDAGILLSLALEDQLAKEISARLVEFDQRNLIFSF